MPTKINGKDLLNQTEIRDAVGYKGQSMTAVMRDAKLNPVVTVGNTKLYDPEIIPVLKKFKAERWARKTGHIDAAIAKRREQLSKETLKDAPKETPAATSAEGPAPIPTSFVGRVVTQLNELSAKQGAMERQLAAQNADIVRMAEILAELAKAWGVKLPAPTVPLNGVRANGG